MILDAKMSKTKMQAKADRMDAYIAARVMSGQFVRPATYAKLWTLLSDIDNMESE